MSTKTPNRQWVAAMIGVSCDTARDLVRAHETRAADRSADLPTLNEKFQMERLRVFLNELAETGVIE